MCIAVLREAAAAMCGNESMSGLSTSRESDEENQTWKLKEAEAKDVKDRKVCEKCEI